MSKTKQPEWAMEIADKLTKPQRSADHPGAWARCKKCKGRYYEHGYKKTSLVWDGDTPIELTICDSFEDENLKRGKSQSEHHLRIIENTANIIASSPAVKELVEVARNMCALKCLACRAGIPMTNAEGGFAIHEEKIKGGVEQSACEAGPLQSALKPFTTSKTSTGGE